MALPRNSACLAIVVLMCATKAAAADGFDNHIYNYLGRGDTVTIGAGDANRANLAIQHPTPWPSYVNRTDIATPSQIGISAMEKMFQRYEAAGSATSSPAAAGQDSSN
jgi:hypothetical protein